MVKPSDSQIFVAIEVGINVRVWVGPDAGPQMPTGTPTWTAKQGLSRTIPVPSYLESRDKAAAHMDDMIDRINMFLQAQAIDKL